MADAPARRRGQTIRDVAEAAGVSIGTVSKALNKSGTLRQETRDRVIRIAGELGFRPNDLAQSLLRGQSFTVGLISNDSFGRFTLPIMEGLERELADRRIGIFMCNATDDPARERQHIEQLMGKRVDGLIFTARRADRRPAMTVSLGDLPTLFVYSRGSDDQSFCLVPDDAQGARLATAHLAGQGRRRIAHVTGPERFEAVRLRREGWRAALAEAGLPDAPYLSGPWSEGCGREAAITLFAGSANRPDAVFAGNDQIARGLVEALRDLGLRVPEDVAVVGFDNWDVMVEGARPRLSSVDMNLYALGQEAGRRIMQLIGGEEFQGVLRLPCTLVVRESSGTATDERSL